jgi:hypothetical protein
MKSLLGRGASTSLLFNRNGLASSRPEAGTRTRYVYVEEELRLTIRCRLISLLFHTVAGMAIHCTLHHDSICGGTT